MCCVCVCVVCVVLCVCCVCVRTYVCTVLMHVCVLCVVDGQMQCNTPFCMKWTNWLTSGTSFPNLSTINWYPKHLCVRLQEGSG